MVGRKIELHRDAHPMRDAVMRALTPAVQKLTDAASGKSVFGSDLELRACVALARLAPTLLAHFPPVSSGPTFHDINPRPDEPWTPERLRLLADLHQADDEDANKPLELVVGYIEEADHE